MTPRRKTSRPQPGDGDKDGKKASETRRGQHRRERAKKRRRK